MDPPSRTWTSTKAIDRNCTLIISKWQVNNQTKWLKNTNGKEIPK